ncbi:MULTISPECIES: LCP family protein [Spirulina sp. CCY15215]|uniref:LCP family protein n=1 Tax=Spirulina sp. CCY15215 TaxID=2767591 RepID=UPI001951AAAB|nr:LCP family protein [Spirulina major]
MRKPVSVKRKSKPSVRRYSQKSPQIGKVRKRKIEKKNARWLWIWLGLTGVGIVSATAGAILAVSLSATPLRQVLLSPEDAAVFNQKEAISSQSLRFPKLTRPVNILVLGTKVLTSDLENPPQDNLGYHALVDSFEGLTDTMLLVRFDPDNYKLSVLSIPRDTRTTIDGFGQMKINAANHYGGAALSAKTISNLLEGVSIDRYVRVNIQAVEKLIDALGGVTVYVPKDMKYTDLSQHLYINLQQGEQLLDGDKAIQFLRFRYDRYGDIGRIQRQQALMRAVVEQTLRPATLLRLPDVIQVLKSNIDTNLSVEEIAALAGFVSHTNRQDVQMLMLPGDFNGTGEKEVSYWIPNSRRIRTMVAQHFDQGYNESDPTRKGAVKIAIQDSTGNPEAIATLKQILQEQGYGNFFIGTSVSHSLNETHIIAQSGDRNSATELQYALGLGEVLVESTGELNSDITIQLGRDWSRLKEGGDRWTDN